MGPLARYQADIAGKDFSRDGSQLQAVECLQQIYDDVVTPRPPRSFWQRIRETAPPPVSGLYLWGGPGRGKTYLMDRFYEALPPGLGRRIHFHRYMLEVHGALDKLQGTADPLDRVASQQAEGSRVLCIDEFHVTDVADAMLLAGLLTGLFSRGVVLVATSNTAPNDLYADGLQRQRFLPAIEQLAGNCRVFQLEGGKDFRLEHLRHEHIYRVSTGADAIGWLDARLQELAVLPARRQTSIDLSGREVPVRALAGDLVWLTFEELCEQPHSAADYLELAREFHTLMLEAVPVMSEEQDEAVRRFIHLVDALYDHNVTLIVTAGSAPENLYNGRRLQSAFARTASRLTEMSGQAYLARPHRSN